MTGGGMTGGGMTGGGIAFDSRAGGARPARAGVMPGVKKGWLDEDVHLLWSTGGRGGSRL